MAKTDRSFDLSFKAILNISDTINEMPLSPFISLLVSIGGRFNKLDGILLFEYPPPEWQQFRSSKIKRGINIKSHQ